MKIKHSSINFTTLVLLFSPWSDASVGVLAAKNKHRVKGGGGEQGLFTEEAPTHANESRKEVIEEGNVFDTHVEEEVIIENHVDINTYEGLRKVEKKGISKRDDNILDEELENLLELDDDEEDEISVGQGDLFQTLPEEEGSEENYEDINTYEGLRKEELENLLELDVDEEDEISVGQGDLFETLPEEEGSEENYEDINTYEGLRKEEPENLLELDVDEEDEINVGQGNLFETHAEEEVNMENHEDINTYDGLRKVGKKVIPQGDDNILDEELTNLLELDVNENEISAGKSEPQLAQVEEFFLSPVGLENVTVDEEKVVEENMDNLTSSSIAQASNSAASFLTSAALALAPLSSTSWSHLDLGQSGLCAELESWSVSSNRVVDGTRVVLRNCVDGNNWHGRNWAHLSNGQIVSKKDPTKCLEPGRNPREFSRLFVWTCHDVDHQKWHLNTDDGRYYNRGNSNLVLGVGNVSTRNGFAIAGWPLEMRYPSDIHQVGCAQQWNRQCDFTKLTLTPFTNEVQELGIEGSGLCAELESWQNGVSNGMTVVLRNCVDGNINRRARKWFHDPKGRIRNLEDTEYCLEAGRNPQLWDQLFVWKCHEGEGVDWQKWDWNPVDRRNHNKQNYNLVIGVGKLFNNPPVAGKRLEVQWKEEGPLFGCTQQWNQRCDIPPMPPLGQLDNKEWKTLRLPGPGLCAKINGVSNGTPVVLGHCNDMVPNWSHWPDGRIRNRQDIHLCLDAGRNPKKGDGVFVWKCEDVEWHKWDFNPVDKRYHNRERRNLVLSVAGVSEDKPAAESSRLVMDYASNKKHLDCAQQWNHHCDAGNQSRKVAQDHNLATRFAPHLKFDHHSFQFPMRLDYYWRNSHFHKGGEERVMPNYSPSWDRDSFTNSPRWDRFRKERMGISYTVLRECSDRIKIVYHIFYKGQKSCTSLGIGQAHEGDWERVTVEVSQDEQKVYRVRYNQHGGWYTRNGADVWYDEPNHAIVHVGKTANGSYYNAGGRNNFLGVSCSYYADFRNNENSGKELKTWKEGLLESTEQSHEWFNWKGTWGRDGVVGPSPKWSDDQCTRKLCDDDGCDVGLHADNS